MNTKGIEGMLNGVMAATKTTCQRLLRPGREIVKGVPKIIVKNKRMIMGMGTGIAVGVALGALSRQPEINRIKGKQVALLNENERLRKALANLDDRMEGLRKKIEALKAFQFVERAKQTEELRGCIQYQYAAKIYIETGIKKSDGGALSTKEIQYMNAFERILNDEYNDGDAKYIGETVLPLYKEKIDNLIEYDCMPIIEKMIV